MKTRILIFIAVLAAGEVLTSFIGQTMDPPTRTTLSIQTVNGGNGATLALRSYEEARNVARLATLAGYALLAVVLFVPKSKYSTYERL